MSDPESEPKMDEAVNLIDKRVVIGCLLFILVLIFGITLNADLRNQKRKSAANLAHTKDTADKPDRPIPVPKPEQFIHPTTTSTPEDSITLFGWNETDLKFFSTMVSGFVTLLVGGLGLLFTRQYNLQTLAYNKRESERNAVLKANEEAHQKTETLVKTVALLGTTDGKDSSKPQQFGVLMALAELNQLEFALTLLDPMWTSAKIESDYAIWIVDKGLSSLDPRLQELAASILLIHAEDLTKTNGVPRADGGFTWPASFDWQWSDKLKLTAREYLLQALLRAITSIPRNGWNVDALRGAFLTLRSAMVSDSDSSIRHGAARAAELVIKATEQDVQDVYGPDDKYHDIASIRNEIETVLNEIEQGGSDASIAVDDCIAALNTWLNSPGPSSSEDAAGE